MSELKSINVFKAIPTLAFLQNLGFTVVSSIYDEKSFGNFETILAGPMCRFRVVRDRGQIFIEMSRNSDWTPVTDVLKSLNPSLEFPSGLSSEDAEMVARMLHENWMLLEDTPSDSAGAPLLE